jgi:hypothetical protein
MNNMAVCRLPMSLNKLIFMQWMPPNSVESAKGMQTCAKFTAKFSQPFYDINITL